MPRASSSALATIPQQGPADPIWQMQRRMNQEFDRLLRDPFGAVAAPLADFGGMMGGDFGRQMGALMPAMDVKDCGDSLCVQCELPGLRKEDVNIELHNNQLLISGQRDDSWQQEGGNWISQERQFGSFSRSIPLPEGCRPEDVSAEFGDGVLKLKVLKPAPSHPVHRIELK